MPVKAQMLLLESLMFLVCLKVFVAVRPTFFSVFELLLFLLMLIYTHIHTHTHTHTHTHICMHTCTYIFANAHTHTHTFVQMLTHIHICANALSLSHTHTHKALSYKGEGCEWLKQIYSFEVWDSNKLTALIALHYNWQIMQWLYSAVLEPKRGH